MPRRCVFHAPHFPVHIDSETTSDTSEDVRELVSNAIAAAVNAVLFDKIDRQLVDIETMLERLTETSNARLQATTPVCTNGVRDSDPKCIPSSKMRVFSELKLMRLDAQATRLVLCVCR